MLIPLSSVLPVLLIVTPLSETADVSHLTYLRSSVRDLAVSMEIMDEREEMRKECDFCEDLKHLHERFIAYRDAPMSWERHRFPSFQTCSHVLAMNRHYQERIDGWMKMYPNQSVTLLYIKDELREIEETWEWVQEMQTEASRVYDRRARLAWLRHRLGPAAFYLGALPEPIPRWR